jgi:hypothetical protein
MRIDVPHGDCQNFASAPDAILIDLTADGNEDDAIEVTK